MQNFTCCDFNEACWSSHSVNRYFSFSAKNTELKTAILQNCVAIHYSVLVARNGYIRNVVV